MVVEYISIIISFLALAVSIYANYYLPKWQYKAQYRISVILDIFPKLLTDIRESIEKYDYSLKIYHPNPDMNYFSYLLEIYNSGKIEYIRIIDKKLYSNLYIIKNEILDDINIYEGEKGNLWKSIQEEVRLFLTSLDKIGFDLQVFISFISSESIYFAWENREEEIVTSINRWFDEEIKRGRGGIIKLNDKEIEKIKNIFITSVINTKKRAEKIKNKINKIIIEAVIPIMEGYIADPI